MPRGRILRDEALYDIANQAPTSPEQLSELQHLERGLFAIAARTRDRRRREARARARPEDRAAAQSLPAAVGRGHRRRRELLKVLLKASAARHRVAPRLIADAGDLERIATESEPDIPALKGWRRQLFGEDALRFKRGELALTLVKGEVVAIEAKPALRGRTEVSRRARWNA